MSRRDRALQAFANVPLPGDYDYKGIPSGDSVFLYVGQGSGHLKLQDFFEVRKALGLPKNREQPACPCGHAWEYHGPEAPGCVECTCGRTKA